MMKRVKLTAEEEITKQTYNKLAKEWTLQHISKGFWREEMQLFNKLLPEGKILEIGCGGGRDAKELLEMGYDYIGTDISGGLIGEAKKQNPQAIFEQVSLYDLDFGKSFDGFWCAAVLLHIPKRKIGLALDAIKRNLKDGAVGFVAIKEGKGTEMETGNINSQDRRLFVFWQNDEFKKVLAKHGFRIEAEGYRPMSQHPKWLTYHVKVKKL